jgi:glycosyltransferase involved in cell wall biosynthesis
MTLINSYRKILIVNPGPLYPIVMASQDRVVEMIKRLSKDHKVFLATLVKTSKEIDETESGLNGYIVSFFPIWSINRNLSYRLLMGFLYKLQYPIFGFSKRNFYWGNQIIINKILRIINLNDFDIVQIEHWYQAGIFEKIKSNIIKVISSHDLLYEKKELEFNRRFKDKIPFFKLRELEIYKKQEINFYKGADVLISISTIDSDKMKEIAPNSMHITIPIGKDFVGNINEYWAESKTILFYGSMGGEQNVIAFFRFWNSIFPIVKNAVPDVKLIVVGADPPQPIRKLHDGERVIVTGYVNDPTPFIKSSSVMIIPLETGGGFRGRVIDVMSFGIPVIGTHNALDCIEIENGKQGFILDDDHELAIKLIEVVTNPVLASFMSTECKKFVKENYSIEATYGKLSKFYSEL